MPELSVVIGIAVVCLAVWYFGLLGKGLILNIHDASRELNSLLKHQSPLGSVDVKWEAVGDFTAPPASTTISNSRTRQTSFGSDALFFGGVNLLTEIPDWLEWIKVDPAVAGALEHATHEHVENILDMHRVLEHHDYDIASNGSLLNWRGHVGEHQVFQQLLENVGVQNVSMPETSNFAGGDIKLFGDDYQVKFVRDFNTIDNIHNDPLIVPFDTANLPADAVHFDLTSPDLTSEALAGHDVIVADSLSLSGAGEAWLGETADATNLAGDAADVSDAADLIVPGLATALRVWKSGSQRRGALGDGKVRDKAVGRIAKDVALGAGGAAAGAVTGQAIGAAVDVLSGGMTLGLGNVVGGFIGSIIGGRAGSKAAANIDQGKIDRANNRVLESVGEYGLAVERENETLRAQWEEILNHLQTASEKVRHARQKDADFIVDIAARRAADQASETLSDLERTLLSQQQVVNTQPTPWWSRPTLQNRNGWLNAIAETNASRGALSTLLLVDAGPNGRALAEQWLEQLGERRGAIFAAAEVQLQAVRRATIQDRIHLEATAMAERFKKVGDAERRLEPKIQDVKAKTSALEDELLVSGRISSRSHSSAE